MLNVARLGKVSPKIHNAFVNIWVEHKHLPLAIGRRQTCAAALRVLMPGGYKKPMTIYRGSRVSRRRIQGFSWTTDVKMARNFAEKNAVPPIGDMRERDGIVLRTIAPASAILLIRPREEYYDEDEVVVDPYQLGKVEIIERLPATPQ